MESDDLKNKKETLEALEPLHLVLNVLDASVIKYLTKFDEVAREERALEALKVGVIAIQLVRHGVRLTY